jgi:hypothetical protein
MKSKTFMGVSVALVMVLILATPILADTARGKIASDTVKSGGSFVLSNDEYNWVSLAIKARKLAPNTDYYVGWVQYKDGEFHKTVYQTATSDLRGNINYGFINTSQDYNDFKYSSWVFQVFVSENYPPEYNMILWGPEVELLMNP